LLFALHAFLTRSSAPGDTEIVITAGKIEHLAGLFARTWQRPPTAEELKGLIDQHVKEEIFSREAMKLGLDREDTIIRRRLQQKMEFIAEDFAAATEPAEQELEAYLDQHPEVFRTDTRFTFRQIFLDPGQRGDSLERDAAALLAKLGETDGAVDRVELGDRTLLPPELTDESMRTIESYFGADFAAALGEAPLGEWTGPIRSSFGTHLVFVAQRAEPSRPELDEVRDQVVREVMNARREEAQRVFLNSLLDKYEVRIEWPGGEAAPPDGIAGLEP